MTDKVMEDSASMEPQVDDPGRRRFLGFWAGTVSAIVGAAIAVPLAGMFLAPLFVKKKELWLTLGKLSDAREGVPSKFTFSYVKTDGWFEKTVYGTAYVVRNGSNINVLSNICTHLGCGVRWDPSKSAFLCPCHNGVFSKDGTNIGGPPPKPLDRFTSRVTGGVIEIQIEVV